MIEIEKARIDCAELSPDGTLSLIHIYIAGLPVAVNVGCHVTRHASAIL